MPTLVKPKVWNLKSCPVCGGDLHLEDEYSKRDLFTTYKCLQCSRVQIIMSLEER